MKKRFFAMLLCIIAVMTLCVFPMTISAEETVDVETTVADMTRVEEPSTDVEPTVSEGDEASEDSERTYHSIFTRIWEFIGTYPEETVSVLGSAVLLVINLSLKHSTRKVSKETKETLKNIKGDVGLTLGGQTSVVDAVNNMIDGYNGMKQSYDLYGATECDRNRIVGAVFATNTAILEILTTVYVNSKNLPQGVKDLVNLKYANCLKTLEDDEQLRAIVEAVRNNIGATTESTETQTENAEV